MRKNTDVANSVSHKRVKYQFQTLNIMSYTKMTNLWQFGDLKICILRSKLLSFLCTTVYKVFELNFLQVCGIYHWLHFLFFFTIFENLQIVFSNFFKHWDHWCLGAQNLLSQTFCYKSFQQCLVDSTATICVDYLYFRISCHRKMPQTS